MLRSRTRLYFGYKPESHPGPPGETAATLKLCFVFREKRTKGLYCRSKKFSQMLCRNIGVDHVTFQGFGYIQVSRRTLAFDTLRMCHLNSEVLPSICTHECFCLLTVNESHYESFSLFLITFWLLKVVQIINAIVMGRLKSRASGFWH